MTSQLSVKNLIGFNDASHGVPPWEPCGQDVPMLSRAFPQRAPVTGGRILELIGGGVVYGWVVNQWRGRCVWWLQGINLQDFQQSLYDFNSLDQTKRRLLKNIREAQEAPRFSTWNLFEKKQLKVWWMKLMILSFQCWGHSDSGFRGPKTPPKLRCLL